MDRGRRLCCPHASCRQVAPYCLTCEGQGIVSRVINAEPGSSIPVFARPVCQACLPYTTSIGRGDWNQKTLRKSASHGLGGEDRLLWIAVTWLRETEQKMSGPFP